MKNAHKEIYYETHYCPARYLDGEKLAELSARIIELGALCFDEVPQYQVFLGDRKAFDDKVLALAYAGERLVGFCSMIILRVPHVGQVLHLGLTCVHPDFRSLGLTHRLTSKAFMRYVTRAGRIFTRTWVSNCAAVLSSLANVSLHFDEVYPSIKHQREPSAKHIRIAEAIAQKYRKEIYIHDTAAFDLQSFVFRGSIKDTPFMKEESDARYYHRNRNQNDFYKGLLDFENGDELLQIGCASLGTYLKHGMQELQKSLKTQLKALSLGRRSPDQLQPVGGDLL